MKRRNQGYEITADNTSPNCSGADDLGRRNTMRRIKHSNRTLVVSGVMLMTAALSVVFPLAALAGNGPPVGF
jgi:hypothetical protein